MFGHNFPVFYSQSWPFLFSSFDINVYFQWQSNFGEWKVFLITKHRVIWGELASIAVHKHHQMDRSQVGKKAILNIISGELEAGVGQDSAEICLQRWQQMSRGLVTWCDGPDFTSIFTNIAKPQIDKFGIKQKSDLDVYMEVKKCSVFTQIRLTKESKKHKRQYLENL